MSGRVEELKKTRDDLKRSRRSLKYKLERYMQAKWVVTEVSRITQSKFKERVETLVTKAITSVFDRPFEFYLSFKKARGTLEIEPRVREGGVTYVPKDDMGGGIIDLLSSAFRFVLWSIEKRRSRNVFTLDEPMKYVGEGIFLERAGNMLKEISHRLGFQLIIVTHEHELANIADRAWEVTHNGTHSEVRQIKGQTRRLSHG